MPTDDASEEAIVAAMAACEYSPTECNVEFYRELSHGDGFSQRNAREIRRVARALDTFASAAVARERERAAKVAHDVAVAAYERMAAEKRDEPQRFTSADVDESIGNAASNIEAAIREGRA